MFWRDILPPSSGSKGKSGIQQEACYLLLDYYLLDLFFDPDVPPKQNFYWTTMTVHNPGHSAILSRVFLRQKKHITPQRMD
jgi:hypothetical protein